MLDYSGGNAYKCTQNRGNQVQILPLEPFDAAALRSALLMAFGPTNRRRRQRAQPRRMALSKRSASKGSVENPGYLSTIPKMDLVEQARQIAPTVTESNAVVYILRLASGAFYVGSTLNLPQRMADHVAGIGCKTTRNDPPLLLLLVEPHPTFSAARKREAQIKRWSRAKKEAFVTRDMEALKQLSKSRESVN